MIHKGQHRKILVAPLNWGLGHAARSIPIINSLKQQKFQPILGGDGASLDLLKKEFPELPFYELPSSSVNYTENGKLLKFKLLAQLPKFLKTLSEERSLTENIHKKENLSGIISDNRLGVICDKIPSIYVTHQIQVLSGNTSLMTSYFHQKFMSKFKECWVPDFESNELAGELSRPGKINSNLKYIGPLSRFKPHSQSKKWDIVVILSGPEPQRSILEDKLIKTLGKHKGKILIIRGVVEEEQSKRQLGNLTIVNFMLQDELSEAIERGKLIISRSGYTTVMDLHKLRARVFFIPTPGQYEQEYLARHLKEKGYADFSHQDSFQLEKLDNITYSKGFGYKKTPKSNFDKSLFDVFR